jgi:hypothetical protein
VSSFARSKISITLQGGGYKFLMRRIVFVTIISIFLLTVLSSFLEPLGSQPVVGPGNMYSSVNPNPIKDNERCKLAKCKHCCPKVVFSHFAFAFASSSARPSAPPISPLSQSSSYTHLIESLRKRFRNKVRTAHPNSRMERLNRQYCTKWRRTSHKEERRYHS